MSLRSNSYASPGLKLYDADVRNGTVFIRPGKGKKGRYVPIGERAIKWIEKYLCEVRPELVVEPDDMTLFLSQYSEAFSCYATPWLR